MKEVDYAACRAVSGSTNVLVSMVKMAATDCKDVTDDSGVNV